MSMIEAAKDYAHRAHDAIKQVRKYSGKPYWTHTDQVAGIVATVTNDEEVISAAHLHDVLEDVFPEREIWSESAIRSQFGLRVADLVVELTDEFTKEKYPNLNRAARKKFERERIGNCSPDAKTIKCADIISNLSDLSEQDPDFAKVYFDEKGRAMTFLIGAHPTLHRQAVDLILSGAEKLIAIPK
jgi:(p)ppGpp synthase/HD superfamily hydrolase